MNNNKQELDAFEAYMALLANFDSFEDFIKARDAKEPANEN